VEISVICPICGLETMAYGSPKVLARGLEGTRCTSCGCDISEDLLKEFKMSNLYKDDTGMDPVFDEERQRQFEESLLEKYDD